MFDKLIKLFVILLVLYQTPVYSKSASFKDFNSKGLCKRGFSRHLPATTHDLVFTTNSFRLN